MKFHSLGLLTDLTDSVYCLGSPFVVGFGCIQVAHKITRAVCARLDPHTFAVQQKNPIKMYSKELCVLSLRTTKKNRNKNNVQNDLPWR